VSPKVRLYLIIGAAAVVLLGGGTFATIELLTNRVNAAIPQADLFGTTPPPTSAAGTPSATPSPTPPAGADIKGPLNILIAGVDTREDEPAWQPHADAVMIMHVNADLQSAYLTSLPRDLVVNVPAFAPAKFSGERTKLTHSMSFGSVVPGSKTPSPAQGFQLLAKTVSAYTGIDHFDAGAVLSFNGMRHFIDALGGIDMHIDQQTVSIHLAPDASGRTRCASCDHGVTGPAMTYNVGTTMHLVGWQALDYARQRYLPGGDYTRQRHQRQMIKTVMAKILSQDYLSNPSKIDALITSLGQTILLDGRGRKPTEFAYALRNLTPDKVTLVGLPGTGAYAGGAYIGENLNAIEAPFFAALNANTLPDFLAKNPGLLSSGQAG
jgi:LCP family protein required for cell wall assembly